MTFQIWSPKTSPYMKKPFRINGRTSGRLLPMHPAAAALPESAAECRRRLLHVILFIAAVALPCAILYMAAGPVAKSPWDLRPAAAAIGGNETLHASPAQESEELRLEWVLKAAAMEDKTVILTTLNAAWASPNSVIDLFIESFRNGNGTRQLLDHMVIVALDEKAYARCITIHNHCFALRTEGVDFSGEKHFMSTGYLKMMWRRINFLRVVLEMGYNFIFTDADIMWFRNPLHHFHPDGDFQTACDHFVGDPTSLRNMANGGFNFARSNPRTIKFYKIWYSKRVDHPGRHDQDVFNIIKHDRVFTEIGLRMRFLSTDYFGGICEPSRDFNKVCTMHANCCVGLNRKIHDLGVMLEDWRRYMSLSPILKEARASFWRVPMNCSMHN